MRVRSVFPYEREPEKLTTFFQWMRAFVAELGATINGNLTFGDGTDPDNISGIWVDIADTGSAGVEFPVLHDLGVVPSGFLLMIPPQAGVVNNGATAWDTSNIFLSCSIANQSIRVFILSPIVDQS